MQLKFNVCYKKRKQDSLLFKTKVFNYLCNILVQSNFIYFQPTGVTERGVQVVERVPDIQGGFQRQTQREVRVAGLHCSH